MSIMYMLKTFNYVSVIGFVVFTLCFKLFPSDCERFCADIVFMPHLNV